MNQKQYAKYMLSVIARELQQQAVLANTWPTVTKTITNAALEAKRELDKQTSND